MTPERLQEVARIYDLAIACADGARRAEVVREACAGDDELRRDVEALLDQPASADGFLERPALEVAAALVSDPTAPGRGPRRLVAGTRLGPYEITAPLGAGGMDI
jgi:serine/threonine-protein kinase